MSYPGFCAKYGQNRMLQCSLAFGLAAGAGVDVMQISSAGYGTVVGLVGGSYGLLAATFSHDWTNKYCAKHDIGVSSGGKLVKTVQAASYATVLTTFIGLSQVALLSSEEQDVESNIIPVSYESDRQPQSIKQLANQHGLALAG